MHWRADDESLLIPSVLPKWFIIPSIVWSSLNNSRSSELAAPACHSLSCSSQRKQSGHGLTMGFFSLNCLFWVISPLRSDSLVSLEVPAPVPLAAFFTGILKLCFLSKEGSNALLTNPRSQIPAQLPTAARASPIPALLWEEMGKGTFPTATSTAREMWVGFTDFISKCLGSLKNFTSKLLCPAENSG